MNWFRDRDDLQAQADARCRRISLSRPIENERSRRPGRAGGEKKTKLSSGSAGAALARAVADDGWMSAVARSTERGIPLHVMGAATLSNGCRDYCVVAKTAAKDLLCSGLRYAMKD